MLGFTPKPEAVNSSSQPMLDSTFGGQRTACSLPPEWRRVGLHVGWMPALLGVRARRMLAFEGMNPGCPRCLCSVVAEGFWLWWAGWFLLLRSSKFGPSPSLLQRHLPPLCGVWSGFHLWTGCFQVMHPPGRDSGWPVSGPTGQSRDWGSTAQSECTCH